MKRLALLMLLSCIGLTLFSQSGIKTPEQFFGFQPGSDRNLIDYEELISYLTELDLHSNRLEMRKVGESPMGKPMYIAFFSSPVNIVKLDYYQKLNKKLALDPGLSEGELKAIVSSGKVFVMAALSMHSSEVGPAQSAPIIAHRLCTSNEPEVLDWLSEVVFMMIPNHNPDGMNMVVNHYRETRGTVHEGASLPGVYHKYVGHDNNRDFVTLSQKDTKVIARIYNTEWYPQVFVEKHQMGATGTRYFVPPNHDPIAENVDESIWNWTKIFGSDLMYNMTRDSLAGVSQNYLFDDYWPGSTETCIWKNVIGFLTECASVQTATPVYIEPSELRVGGKGLAEYKKSINMPYPWPGGWWKLSDIVDYELSSTWSILNTACENKDRILRFRNEICRKMVNMGQENPPYQYILPAEQHDPGELVHLVNLLHEHGVNVYYLTSDVEHENSKFRAGDIVVPLNQPYRAFIKEVMEEQNFPVRRYTPGGEIIKPYDITSWSLPLHNGLTCYEINTQIEDIRNNLHVVEQPFTFRSKANPGGKYLLLDASYNLSYKTAFQLSGMGITLFRTKKDQTINNQLLPAGSFYVKSSDLNDQARQFVLEQALDFAWGDTQPEGDKLEIPRIALVESWFHDMDAGWTRFVLDSYHIPFTVIRPGNISETDLSLFDIIIFPDESEFVLLQGKYSQGSSYYVSSYQPEYTKGMGSKGLQKVLEFIDKGGKVVSWGESVTLFDGSKKIYEDTDNMEEFQLPFADLSKSLESANVYCPGSLMKIKVTDSHPVSYGMPDEVGIFFRGRHAFRTTVPRFDMDRRIIGIFPEEDILMSGYCENEEKLSDLPVLLWIKKGEGQLVLMGFNPQFRASTHSTYKFLFNSILL